MPQSVPVMTPSADMRNAATAAKGLKSNDFPKPLIPDPAVAVTVKQRTDASCMDKHSQDATAASVSDEQLQSPMTNPGTCTAPVTPLLILANHILAEQLTPTPAPPPVGCSASTLLLDSLVNIANNQHRAEE